MKNNQNNEILFGQKPFSFDTNEVSTDLFSRSHKPKTVHWSIVWSDLMMTMFVVFLVLYVFYSAKTETPLVKGKSTTREIQKTPVPSNTRAKKNPEVIKHAEKSITLKPGSLMDIDNIDLVSDQAVRIILPGDLMFDKGMAEIKPSAKQSLERIAGIIQKTPYIVNVIGHTDNDPIHSKIFATNWELSVIRASTIARFLMEDMKIPGNRFYISGHASYLPIADNNTQAGKARNRRVEIVITKELPKVTQWQLTEPFESPQIVDARPSLY
jgi:chemotaxis protein MotB